MSVIYLALGSNVGDSRAHIETAIKLLEESVTNIRRAPLYASKAVGYTEQPDFLNTVIEGETTLSPKELLVFVKSVEKRVGRIARFHWGPREIDVDIILYGDQVLNEPDLIIPHPRFKERDFVLKPLCDLNPRYTGLLNQLPPSELSILG